MKSKRYLRFLIPGLLCFFLLACTVIYFRNASAIRVACVGDSITYGAKIKNKKMDSYPSKLQKKLGVGYLVKNFGVSGHTLQDFGDRPYTSTEKYQESLSFQPDIVLIMLGTNDAKPFNWISPEAFKDNYRKLIQSYQELDSQPSIYLMTPATIFPENYTPASPYQMEPELVDEAALAVTELAQELNLPVIDIHSITSEHPEFFLLDGVHPDIQGTECIAENVSDVLKSDGKN